MYEYNDKIKIQYHFMPSLHLPQTLWPGAGLRPAGQAGGQEVGGGARGGGPADLVCADVRHPVPGEHAQVPLHAGQQGILGHHQG